MAWLAERRPAGLAVGRGAPLGRGPLVRQRPRARVVAGVDRAAAGAASSRCEGAPPPVRPLVFSAWFAGGLNLWSYLRTTIGVPAPVPLLTAALPAAVVTGGALLARRHARRGRWSVAVLALPATWTAFELACARLSPHGSFGSLAPIAGGLPAGRAARGAGRRQRRRLPAPLLCVRRGRGFAARRAAPAIALTLAGVAGAGARLRHAGASRRPTSRARASPSALRRAISRSSRPPWTAAAGRELEQRLAAPSHRCAPPVRR